MLRHGSVEGGWRLIGLTGTRVDCEAADVPPKAHSVARAIRRLRLDEESTTTGLVRCQMFWEPALSPILVSVQDGNHMIARPAHSRDVCHRARTSFRRSSWKTFACKSCVCLRDWQRCAVNCVGGLFSLGVRRRATLLINAPRRFLMHRAAFFGMFVSRAAGGAGGLRLHRWGLLVLSVHLFQHCKPVYRYRCPHGTSDISSCVLCPKAKHHWRAK
mmetsp:Transcript_34082/g.77184  ORF Transcript_34082/g.77184 Transcript_34082/m.77184 type:complete len:216 (-) Transcript_34082:52-699(-)